MARVKSVNLQGLKGYMAKVLEAQAKTWGGPLLNHLVYAHRPDLFKAVRGMWSAINKDQLLNPRIVALINRRVASLNHCEF